MKSIILAGGSGSRLWPLSRDMYPKQLLNLDTDKSLLQQTFVRLSNFANASDIVTVTNVKHFQDIKLQLNKLNKDNVVIAEPLGKNTAPAIACALEYFRQKDECDDIVLVVPSDHLIRNTELFNQTVKEAEILASSGYIVTFGIKPSYPETGYGYIKTLKPLDVGYKVEKFVEKPDLKTAEKYLQSGEYYWNGGIFMAKISVLLEEFANFCPDIFDNLKALDYSNDEKIRYGIYENMPSISIDYAIMEKSKNLALVELESDWKDLGSWQSIYDISPKDNKGNVFIGHVLDNGSKNSFVYSSSKLVATIGLEDTVIVETEDAILACKKDRTQDVKQIYETLKQQHDDTHLVHKTVYRPWGFYTVIAQGEGFLTKLIHVNQGQKLSVQSHNFRSEHWVVLSGRAKVLLDGKEVVLTPGHSVDIPLKAVHSLQNPYNEDLEIVEVQKGSPLIEEDIVRYEDMYGRV